MCSGCGCCDAYESCVPMGGDCASGHTCEDDGRLPEVDSTDPHAMERDDCDLAERRLLGGDAANGPDDESWDDELTATAG
mgnify:CR=1 FL=1